MIRRSTLCNVLILAVYAALSASPSLAVDSAQPQQVFWGDTHLHTSLSGDAIAFGLLRTPADAYDLALGKEIPAGNGKTIKLTRPMDFLVIADHAEGYGMVTAIMAGNTALLADTTVQRWARLIAEGENVRAGIEMIAAQANGRVPEVVLEQGPAIARSTWLDALRTAEAYNEPGKFSAMLGFEWSSLVRGNNLHRVVIFRDDSEKLENLVPLDSNVSGMNPEKLWAWMGDYEDKTGGRVLAIPHNPNLSNGMMFPLLGWDGAPLTAAHAAARSRWEPLLEVSQIKGDSEAHPLLSRNDEFADFETWDNGNLDGSQAKTAPMLAGEYAREALKSGLGIEQLTGVNPYKFGMVGATDSHTSVTASEEANFWGKFVNTEPSEGRWKKHRKATLQDGWEYAAAGLTAVWASENTRASLFDAMHRREAYATTGSRIVLRIFAGWDFTSHDLESFDMVQRGYAGGVPMGGDLSAAPEGKAPALMVMAHKDPLGGNLDRVQVIKGWLDTDNQTHERVYDVVWSGARVPDKHGNLPPVGNTVNIAEATWIDSIGEPQLSALWRDPDFDPDQSAFYYVRVLEIPTPRWTAYDAKRFNQKMDEEVPMTLQERAYSSPIWYSPGGR